MVKFSFYSGNDNFMSRTWNTAVKAIAYGKEAKEHVFGRVDGKNYWHNPCDMEKFRDEIEKIHVGKNLQYSALQYFVIKMKEQSEFNKMNITKL